MKCQECKWCLQQTELTAQGPRMSHNCRRYPPTSQQIIVMDPKTGPRVVGASSHFPVVEPTWHCGEWEKGIIRFPKSKRVLLAFSPPPAGG